MYPGTPINLVADADVPYPELPTIRGAFEAMTLSIETFISKLEDIDIDSIGDNIIGILRGANELVNKSEHEETVTDLQASMRSLSVLLKDLENAGFDDTVAAANGVLTDVELTLKLVKEVLQPDAPLQYNLIKVTGELEETARAIRSLVETLERQPQSVIFGLKPQEEGGTDQK
jgi:paraquat-inducible protein B